MKYVREGLIAARFRLDPLGTLNTARQDDAQVSIISWLNLDYPYCDWGSYLKATNRNVGLKLLNALWLARFLGGVCSSGRTKLSLMVKN